MSISIDDGLGYRERGALADSSANKQKRRRVLPMFMPPKGNTHLLACLIFNIDEGYNVAIMAMVV
jgi:hypothetical protein